MVKVSIIVPVYNVEKYIERCISSLVNQTLDDIEIIIVNDGSTDNSERIIKKYEKKYKNVKYYTKENGGMSSARNYGLKYASGVYISFVDSDDYIEEDMIEKLYNKAVKGDFDLVVCDLDTVDDEGNLISNVSSNVDDDLYNNDIKKCMLNIYPSVWNKLYNKRLFDNGVLFKEGVWFEDVEFIYRLFPYIRSIGVVKNDLYHYVKRAGSVTKTFDERLHHYIDNWNGIVCYYRDNNFYNEYKLELEYCYVRYLFATFIKQATNYTDKELYLKCVDDAIINVKDKFPYYRKNLSLA